METPVMVEEVERSLEEVGGLDRLRRMSPDMNVVRRLEKVYGLLACSSRIEILYYLNFTPLTPGLLCLLTGMAPNLMSFHLKKLKRAGLVDVSRSGRYLIYDITELGRGVSGPLNG